MPDVVEAAVNSIRVTPCPGCAAQRLLPPRWAESPCLVTCGGCDRWWEVLADVTVVRDAHRLRGNCCAGFHRHELLWQQRPGSTPQSTTFQTWAQDRLLLRPADLVSVLFGPGELAKADTRARPRIPLLVANHTIRAVWALVGSAPVALLR